MTKDVTPSVPASEFGTEYYRRQVPRTTALQQILAIIYRQRFPLLIAIVTSIALGVAITLILPKKYSAVSTVQLEQQVPQVIALPDLDPQPDDANRFLQTQLDRLHSRSLAQRVATQLKIVQSPQIQKALGVDAVGATNSSNAVIAALQENVLAELGLNTRLARISFVSEDPVVSADIANAYAEALIASNLSGKADTSSRAQQYLLDQLADAKQKLENSERRMLNYARGARLTSTVSEAGSLPTQQLLQLTNSLAAATARRIDAQQQWQQVKGTSAMILPEVQENRAIQELMAQKAQFQATLAQDRQRHTDEFPSVAATKAQIRELDGDIRSLSSNIKQSFSLRYRAAAQQEQRLQAKVEQLRNEAMAEQDRGVEYNTLAREVETNKVAYDGLLQRYRDVSSAAGAPAVNVMLVDRAEPPLDPSSPNLLWNLAFAGLCGLIVAMIIGLIRERVHDVIRSAEDLESVGDLSVLGIVPALESGKNIRDALSDPRSSHSEAYHSIAASLSQLTPEGPPKTMLITSSMASEGKSTTTWGLGLGLATLGYRVLVINGDLRHPSREPGFAEALAGSVNPRDTITVMKKQGFAIIDSGREIDDPVALLSESRIKRVLDELSGIADIMIIDGPPILGLADAVLLANCVDAVAMVVEANRVHAGQLDVAMSRLPRVAAAGGILTKFDAKLAGVSYGSHSYYKYGRTYEELR